VTTTAKPITQIGSPSSGNTTFTATTVVDGSAWDLSDVAEGYIITTSDGFRASIEAVNDGANTLTLDGWVDKGGRSGRGLALLRPTDGAVVTVHKMESCGRLLIDAIDENTADVFLGFSSDVSYDPASADVGHEIAASATQGNHRMILKPEMTKELDLTEVWVIAASTQNLAWIGM
jgi:hypothetical protein